MPENQAIANVARHLATASREMPEIVALKTPVGGCMGSDISYQTLSFSELENLANAAANLLINKGIVRGTRVLLMVKPGTELILLCFALFKIGAVPVVIDPGMGLRGFCKCVEHTKPSALLGIPLAQIVSRALPKSFSSLSVRINVGSGFTRKLKSYQGAFETAKTTTDELAAILFTSGSTGPAKGVCYTHGMFEAQVRMIRERFQIEPGEVDLPMLPVFALFNPALRMTTVVPKMNPSRPATVNPAHIVFAINQNMVTNSFGSPVLWSKITRYCEENNIKLPSIKRVLMAGAPVPPELIERFSNIIPNGEIFSPYGATECLPVSAISGTEVLEETRQKTLSGDGTCVGFPLPGVKVRIIPIQEQAISGFQVIDNLPGEEIGEIVVTGPTVTREYDGLPDATERSKIIDGDTIWHRMGDAGYIDGDGKLWFCGRVVERVITEKGTLFTDCCEAIFNRHPEIFRTALIGIGERGSEIPAIVAEPNPDCWPIGQQAKNLLKEKLLELGASSAITKDIQHVYFRKKLPVDVRHNAKIHRLELKRIYS